MRMCACLAVSPVGSHLFVDAHQQKRLAVQRWIQLTVHDSEEMMKILGDRLTIR